MSINVLHPKQNNKLGYSTLSGFGIPQFHELETKPNRKKATHNDSKTSYISNTAVTRRVIIGIYCMLFNIYQ